MGQNKRLTELQRNFVENIVESAGRKTAAQCAIEAGYSTEAAVVYASKLQNPKLYPLVTKYIEELRVKKRENLDLVFIKHMDRLNYLLEAASEHLSKDLKNGKYRKVISVVKELQPLHSFYGMTAIKVYLAEEARPYKTGHFKIGKTTQRKVEDRGKFTDNPYGMNYICYFEYVPSNGFNLEKNLHHFFRFYSTYNEEYSGSSEWFKIKNREKLIKTFKKIGNKLLEKNNCLSVFIMNDKEKFIGVKKIKKNSKEENELAEKFFGSIYETKKPDSKTIYHVGLKKWVKRDSNEGDEAWEIQAERSYKTWLEENNYEME